MLLKDGYDFRTDDKETETMVQVTSQEECCYCMHSESILYILKKEVENKTQGYDAKREG
jgi:hypothetical protein